MGPVFIVIISFFNFPYELYDLMLSFSRLIRSWKYHLNLFPFLIRFYFLLDEILKHLIQLRHKISTRSNRITLKICSLSLTKFTKVFLRLFSTFSSQISKFINKNLLVLYWFIFTLGHTPSIAINNIF